LLGVCGALAVGAVAAAPAAAATGDHFICRASALRVTGAGALNAEPEVANQAGDPCRSSQSATGNARLPGLLSAVAGPASTSGTSSGGSGAAQVTGADLQALGITADAASAHAAYSCSDGQPVPAASSKVANLRIGGGAAITTSGPMDLGAGGIADVQLNRTITGASSVTQRAVDITVHGGPYSGAEVVLGEATAGLSGNPCDVGTADLRAPSVKGGPPSSTGRNPRFAFSTQPGTTLQCSLDNHSYAPCDTTTSFRNLSYGWHVLSAREVRDGVVGPALTFRWDVTRRAAAGCPAATGRLRGRTLGLVHLGMTRRQARRAYRLNSSWSTLSQDFFCLKPIGVRVEYASSSLLRGLRAAGRRALLGRVVMALTANRHFALMGIRPGATLRAARRALGAGNLFHIGINGWYFVAHGSWTAVLKLHGRTVAEVGIADARLTRGRRAQLAFIRRSR
jgi:hypothetical protein